jgi:hypothetical protein
MPKEPKTMAELHKIREEHFELTKNKKLSFVVREMERESKEIVQKHKLKIPREVKKK